MIRRDQWVVIAWLLFVLACALAVSRSQFTADLSAFLPRSPTPAQQVLVEQLRDGVVSRLVLIAVDGAAPEALAKESKALAAVLRKDERFVSVDNGEDAGLAADREFLWRNRYLLSPAVGPGYFSAEQLRAALEENLQLLGSPAGMFVQKILPNDPTGELLRLVERLAGQAQPSKQHGVWFSRDGKRALLVAQTRGRGYDIDAQEDAIAAIRSAFGRVRAPGEPAALELTGPGVFSVASRERIKNDTTRISLVATLMVGAMLLALYRSPRVLILALLPVATGALAGVASVGVAFASVHGITLGFGATLIGEGVDYAIYLLTRVGPGVPPQGALGRIWPTLRLGLLTSICGFSAMLFSGFTGLAQLGLFSITGLIVALTVTRYVLPTLLPDGFKADAAAALGPRIAALISGAGRLRYLALALVVAVVAAAAVSRGPVWSDDLVSLSPISRAEQQRDEQLRRDIGAPDVRHLIVVTARDAQSALKATEAVAARLQEAVSRGVLESYDAPSNYLPSFAAQRARQSALPERAVLRANLEQAARGLPFRSDLFNPFFDDVEKARTAPPLDRSDLEGTRLAMKVDSLLVDRGASWAAMLPLRGVADAAALGKEIPAVPGAEAILLDIKDASDALYQAYRREALRNALLGVGAILVLLLVALRSLRRLLDVTAPLVAAVAVTTSAVLLTGTPLSIFHLVGLLLVVAVGSNYSLFFDRQAAGAADRECTLVSLVFANVTTVIGFGLLSFSQVPVLRAIGFTVAIGAVLSLVFAAILGARSRR